MNRQDTLTHLRAIRKFYEASLASVQQTHDLTLFEADILAFLYCNSQLNTANHIVEYRMLPKANVSKAIDSLLRRGWLTAARDEADRRRVLLSLTQEAIPVTQEVLAAQEQFYSQLQTGFTPEETNYYETVMQRITTNARNGLERS